MQNLQQAISTCLSFGWVINNKAKNDTSLQTFVHYSLRYATTNGVSTYITSYWHGWQKNSPSPCVCKSRYEVTIPRRTIDHVQTCTVMRYQAQNFHALEHVWHF